SIAESKAGQKFRKSILQECDLLEVLTLPEGLFHSQIETLALVARKRESQRITVPVTTVRELKSRDLPRFAQSAVFTRTYSVGLDRWSGDAESRFVISPLLDLWERLEKMHEPLGKVAEVRAGLKVKAGDTTSVHDTRQSGDVAFLDRKDVLKPFALLMKGERSDQWLSYGDHLERPRTAATFDPAKVLVNSNRNPGSPWRLVAAMAPAKLYYSFSFHGVFTRPGSDCSLEMLTAVLNSPLANAWFDAHSRKRWIHVPTLERLPLPQVDNAMAGRIATRVELLADATRRKWQSNRREGRGLFDDDGESPSTEVSMLLSELDDLVFLAYGLTTSERRAIQRLMIGERRPGQ
ncbi:MAG: hypothetical protein ABL986_22480, partial [Vicinamibacterales bacterium]